MKRDFYVAKVKCIFNLLNYYTIINWFYKIWFNKVGFTNWYYKIWVYKVDFTLSKSCKLFESSGPKLGCIKSFCDHDHE